VLFSVDVCNSLIRLSRRSLLARRVSLSRAEVSAFDRKRVVNARNFINSHEEGRPVRVPRRKPLD